MQDWVVVEQRKDASTLAVIHLVHEATDESVRNAPCLCQSKELHSSESLRKRTVFPRGPRINNLPHWLHSPAYPDQC